MAPTQPPFPLPARLRDRAPVLRSPPTCVAKEGRCVGVSRRLRSLLAPVSLPCCQTGGLICAFVDCQFKCANLPDPPAVVVGSAANSLTNMKVYLTPPLDTGGLNIRELPQTERNVT